MLSERLEAVKNQLQEVIQQLSQISEKVSELESTLILTVQATNNAYIKYNPDGSINAISLTDPNDPSYIPVKLSNENVRGAVRKWFLSQTDEYKQLKELETRKKVLQLEYDYLKVLIKAQPDVQEDRSEIKEVENGS